MVSFAVYGRPQQRGSKQAHVRYDRAGKPVSKDGRVLTFAKDMNENSKAWMDTVRSAAIDALPPGWEPVRGPVKLGAVFWFARPNAHYGTGRNAGTLKASTPKYYTSFPDLSKLMRAIEDAMTGVVYVDDRQISRYGDVSKAWTTGIEHAQITVEVLQ